MDTFEAIRARCSIREFTSQPVPKDTVLKLLELATRAPSSANTQGWEMFVAGGPVMEKIRQAYIQRFKENKPSQSELRGIPPAQMPAPMRDRMNQMRAERFKGDEALSKANMERSHHFFGAPVLVVVCMPRVLSVFSSFDMGCMVQTLCLAATAQGLGSIIAGGFVSQPDILRKELEIPDDLIIVTGVVLGYEDKKNPVNNYHSSRRPIMDVVRIKGL